MKKLLLIPLILQVMSSNGQDFDYTYFDQSLTSNLRDVFFVNDEVGYAVSYYGAVIKSIDGGETWELTSLENELPLHGLAFIDENVGVAVGGDAGCSPTPCDIPGSKIFRTTDGGVTWTTTSPDQLELYTVTFSDASHGISAGLGNMFRTENGGETWEEIELEIFYNIQDIEFSNDIVFASCLFGKMIASTDNGMTWSELDTGVSTHLYTLDFAASDIGFGAGQGDFIRTFDGGQSWEVLDNAPSEIYSITAFDSDNLIASGRGAWAGNEFQGSIYFSSDGGNSWTNNDTLAISSIAYTHFVSNNLGFAVGQGSKILKLSVDNTNSNQLVGEVRPMVVYPNPSNGIFTFLGHDSAASSSIAVRDISGQVVFEMSDFHGQLDITSLPPGVYNVQFLTPKHIRPVNLVVN